jgi:CheY-like chemotaxis protein
MKIIDIFYADDDEDDLMFFTEAVEKISKVAEAKIALHVHKNGESLIDNIKKNKDAHGVVFLDINMPLKSGFDLLEEIRKDTEIKEFPVVMYSTSSNQDNIDKSKALGANYYVIKPYKFSMLMEMIASFINMDWDNPQGSDHTFLYK